jgi:DNA polymerase I-like protein with 3'-5' exonuclease and polymerase domains
MLNTKYLVVDTETNAGSIKGNLTDLWCIGFYDPYENFKYLYADYELGREGVKKFIQELFDTHTLIFHHAAFDIWVLESFGFTVTDFHDTMMMSYCLFPGQEHGLKALGERYDCEVTKTEFNDFSHYSDEMGEYCMNDCESTWNIFEKMLPIVESDNKVNNIYQVELEFVRDLIGLRNNGVFVDLFDWREVIKEVQAKQDELHSKIMSLFPLCPNKPVKTKNPRPADKVCTEDTLELGKFVFDNETDGVWTYKKVEEFNPGSSDQLAYAFTKLYGWKPTKFSDKTGKATVNNEVVESLNYPLANIITNYSELAKLTSTFGESMLDKVGEDGRIRPSFNPTVTLTGRLSCSGVNVRN